MESLTEPARLPFGGLKKYPKHANHGLSAVTFINKRYSWVGHDVTKNQTKKLSILLSFYFHEVLRYLNIFT